MNASTRSRNPLVLSESSKTTTSPLTTAGEPILAQQHGRRNRLLPFALVQAVIVMGRNALRKNPFLAAKQVVGGDVKVIQDVTQVLFAAVQVGLNSIGNPGGDVSGFGPAHVLFEDVGLHPTVERVVIYISGRTGGCARLNRWLVGGLGLRFRHGPPHSFLVPRRIPGLLPCTAEAGKREHQRQHQRCKT